MNNKIEEYNFKVITLQYGQPRPYADHVFEFEIESTLHENIVKTFCESILKPVYYGIRDNFCKIDENKYRYKAKAPYMG